MVFILKPNVEKEKIDKFIAGWERKGFSTIFSIGTEHTAVCLIGNTAEIDLDHVVQTNDIVDYGKRITEQYKAVNRTVHEDNTIINIGAVSIGEGFFTVISGPCSVESKEQILEIAHSVKKKRRENPARRSVQTQNIAVCFSGQAGRRT
jgi:3-deoxy-7-phosphoheptulonate synthase